MRSEEITEEEIAKIERDLCEMIGTNSCETADFACRALVRMLAEVRRLRSANRRLFSLAPNSSLAPSRGSLAVAQAR